MTRAWAGAPASGASGGSSSSSWTGHVQVHRDLSSILLARARATATLLLGLRSAASWFDGNNWRQKRLC